MGIIKIKGCESADITEDYNNSVIIVARTRKGKTIKYRLRDVSRKDIETGEIDGVFFFKRSTTEDEELLREKKSFITGMRKKLQEYESLGADTIFKKGHIRGHIDRVISVLANNDEWIFRNRRELKETVTEDDLKNKKSMGTDLIKLFQKFLKTKYNIKLNPY